MLHRILLFTLVIMSGSSSFCWNWPWEKSKPAPEETPQKAVTPNKNTPPFEPTAARQPITPTTVVATPPKPQEAVPVEEESSEIDEEEAEETEEDSDGEEAEESSEAEEIPDDSNVEEATKPEIKKEKDWNLVAQRGLIVTGVGATALTVLYLMNQHKPMPWEATKEQLITPFTWMHKKISSKSATDKIMGISSLVALGCSLELLASYVFDYESYVKAGFNKIRNLAK